MADCLTCRARIPQDARYCPACGAASQASSLETRTSAPSVPGPAAAGGPRFLPGNMVAGRYRVVSLIGRGGMGEVYRADDLTLGQAVALKFLTPELEHHADRLRRFLDEVRLALKVSHPNVCRVHDVGEVDGIHFISMEFVDGEDLASLLRRIERFPRERAAKVARQICAGLAAAHDQGILHRDLKPANIMIDSRGHAKITDFGLARLGDLAGDAEVRAGTPAYMAPEQRAGLQVTARSDIYALGLVLYELFTGRHAFPEHLTGAPTSSSAPSSPSSIVEGMEPGVERVLLQCLDEDPALRPASVASVAAALPGGDPLAAALAAGETPTPGMVAAAPASALSPPLAVACLAGLALAVALVVLLSPRANLTSLGAPERPTAFLKERARDILADLGYAEPPADSLVAFNHNLAYRHHLHLSGTSPGRWRPLAEPRPAGVLFHYRQSPFPLTRISPGSVGDWLSDPPPIRPGMIQVTLDGQGHLQGVHVVPEQGRGEPGSPLPWETLLSAAALPSQGLTAATADFLPPVPCDARMAWRGTYPEDTDVPILVQAGSMAGRAVYFRILEPWDEGYTAVDAPDSPEPSRDSASSGLAAVISAVVGTAGYLGMLVGLAILASRNLRLGRGDLRNALRFALFLGALRALWILGVRWPGQETTTVVVGHLSYALYRVALMGAFYLAIEPYYRRLWPRTLTSWVRLAQGRLRDPLVGRDLLVGMLFGAATASLLLLGTWLPDAAGWSGPPPLNSFTSLETLRGTRFALMAVFVALTNSILGLLVPLTLLLLFRLVLRRTGLAVLAVSTVGFTVYNPSLDNPVIQIVLFACLAVLFWVVLFRFGLLAAFVSQACAELLLRMPLSPDLASPALSTSIWLTLASLLGLALWGFRAALGGQSVLRDPVLGAEGA